MTVSNMVPLGGLFRCPSDPGIVKEKESTSHDGLVEALESYNESPVFGNHYLKGKNNSFLFKHCVVQLSSSTTLKKCTGFFVVPVKLL